MNKKTAALIVHAYQQDIMDEFFTYIHLFKTQIPDSDVYVSLTKGSALTCQTKWLQDKLESFGCKVFIFENKGMDVGPFFLVLNHILEQDFDYEYVFKIHANLKSSALHINNIPRCLELLSDEETGMIGCVEDIRPINGKYDFNDPKYFPVMNHDHRVHNNEKISLNSGWHDTEYNPSSKDYFMWSEPVSYIAITNMNDNNVILGINKSELIKSNTLIIQVNEEEPLSYEVVNGICEIKLHLPIQRKNVLKITTEYFIPQERRDIGFSDDYRKLGFQLKYIVVDGQKTHAQEINRNDPINHLLQIKEYCKIPAKTNLENLRFIEGTVFWIKFDILKKYFTRVSLNLCYSLLENGYVSGENKITFVHAMKRFFGYLVAQEGKKIVGI